MNHSISRLAGRIREEYEFRGFRHVVRNVYTYKFDPEKVGRLVNEAPKLFHKIRNELLAFVQFLEQA